MKRRAVSCIWRNSCGSSHAPSLLCALMVALPGSWRSEEHTSELQSQSNLVCRLLLEKIDGVAQRVRAQVAGQSQVLRPRINREARGVVRLVRERTVAERAQHDPLGARALGAGRAHQVGFGARDV